MTKKLFLLRGLVRESRHWGDFPKLLQQHLGSDYEIITPDILGVGSFYQTPSPSNFDDMIHAIKKHYPLNKNKSENILMAMSLGGMLAKRWSELYPDDFSHLILCNTSYKKINPLFKRLRPKAVAQFLKLFFTFNLKNREHGIIKLVSNNSAVHEKTLQEWLNIQQLSPVSKKSFLNQITAALNYIPQQQAPASKLLFLAGEKDRLCHPDCTKKIHQLWGGQLSLHPEAGHDLGIDVPEWTIEQVKNFLRAP